MTFSGHDDSTINIVLGLLLLLWDYLTFNPFLFFAWDTFGRPDLSWSDLWKNRPVKQKLKVVVTLFE